MTSFLFQDPHWFWLLLLLPLWILLRGRTGKGAALSFSSIAIAKDVSREKRSRAGQLLFLFRILALAAIITALARPQLGKGHSEVESSGIDIVLAIDVSGSMNALDFSTRTQIATRLDIVKETVREFIENRPGDRIGLIAFGKDPYLVSPLTLNHSWLLKNLERVDIGLIDGSRTAIGPAIGTSVNRLKDLQAEDRVVVLLTDGEDNVRQFPPIAAAEAAKTFGIRIYTIAAGRSGRAPMPRMDAQGNILRDANGDMVFGGYSDMRVDEETLREIAEITDGRFYQATNPDELRQIYDEIDALEKTEVKLRHFSEYDELYHWPLLLGLLLFALELFLSHTVYRKLPG